MDAREPLSAVISAVIGTVLWVAFVVALPDDRTEAPLFWWLMLAAAVALGAIFGSPSVRPVTLGLGLAPLDLLGDRVLELLGKFHAADPRRAVST